MTLRTPYESQPLAVDGEVHVLYEALGAVIHLEPLIAEDETALEEVNDLVHAWLGPHLKQTWASFLDEVQPYERRHLDYISGQLTCLGDCAESMFPRYHREKVDSVGVNVNGASLRANASPFSYRFWMETPTDATYGIVVITVPTDWPLADFQEHLFAIMARLRVRWASLGYTYATWFLLDYKVAARRLKSHALRHVGYDVGYFVNAAEEFHRKVRSVNWLTVLGASLEAEWREGGAAEIPIERVGPHALLRAASEPQRGDKNRLDYPAGYRDIDHALRKVRASDAGELVWLGGWKPDQITEWLRRFELSIS